MSVTLAEVMAAARVHAAPLAGESAGYLVLGLADQMSGAPRSATPAGIRLGEEGALYISDGGAVSSETAEAALRALLDALLLCASSGSAALQRAARRAPGGGLETLVREIEAALIPVNRSAARRALSRLYRETTRARERGELDLAAEPEIAKAPAAPSLPAATVPAPPPAPSLPPVEGALDVDVDVDMGVDVEPAADAGDDEPTHAILLPPPPLAALELSPPPAVSTEAEPQTVPEPAVLRATLRPPGSPIDVQPLRTPRIGSFLSSPAPLVVERAPEAEADADVARTAPPEVVEADCTEPMPELEESPRTVPGALGRVPAPQSDVNALLAAFSVSEPQTDVDVRRTLKEIAGVDLTPGNAPVIVHK